LARGLPAEIFASGAEERVALGFKCAKRNVGGVALDLVEGCDAVDFIFGDEVYFVLAFSVPPSTKPRIATGLRELGCEIAFKGESTECVPVSADDFAQLAEGAEFHRRAVLGDEAEPEEIEVVADAIAKAFCVWLGEKRLDAGYDLVVFLKALKVAAEIAGAYGIFNLCAPGPPARDCGKNREIGAVVLAKLLHKPCASFLNEYGSLADHVVNHLVAGADAMVHQKSNIFGDAPRQREERKKIIGREARRMIGKGRFQRRDRERRDLDEGGFASIERFLAVAEDAVHERIETAADHKVDLGIGVEFIPFALHFAEDSRVDPAEVLKFIDDERDGLFTRISQHPFEDVLETELFARKEYTEFGFDFVAERIAKFFLGTASDKKIKELAICVGMSNQFCLADATTTGNDRKLRMIQRIVVNLAQKRDFFISSVKLHGHTFAIGTSVTGTHVPDAP